MMNRIKIKGQVESYFNDNSLLENRFILKSEERNYEIDLNILTNQIKNKIKRLADRKTLVEFTVILNRHQTLIKCITKVKKIQKSKLSHYKFLPLKYSSTG